MSILDGFKTPTQKKAPASTTPGDGDIGKAIAEIVSAKVAEEKAAIQAKADERVREAEARAKKAEDEAEASATKRYAEKLSQAEARQHAAEAAAQKAARDKAQAEGSAVAERSAREQADSRLGAERAAGDLARRQLAEAHKAAPVNGKDSKHLDELRSNVQNVLDLARAASAKPAVKEIVVDVQKDELGRITQLRIRPDR